MITYKLAKQLKDAGFSQEDVDKAWWKGGKSWTSGIIAAIAVSEEKAYKIPTLSELIEECGDKFLLVRRNVFNDTWYATALSEKVFGKVPQAKNCRTPEIAVTKLLLELYKGRKKITKYKYMSLFTWANKAVKNLSWLDIKLVGFVGICLGVLLSRWILWVAELNVWYLIVLGGLGLLKVWYVVLFK